MIRLFVSTPQQPHAGVRLPECPVSASLNNRTQAAPPPQAICKLGHGQIHNRRSTSLSATSTPYSMNLFWIRTARVSSPILFRQAASCSAACVGSSAPAMSTSPTHSCIANLRSPMWEPQHDANVKHSHSNAAGANTQERPHSQNLLFLAHDQQGAGDSCCWDLST